MQRQHLAVVWSALIYQLNGAILRVENVGNRTAIFPLATTLLRVLNAWAHRLCEVIFRYDEKKDEVFIQY